MCVDEDDIYIYMVYKHHGEHHHHPWYHNNIGWLGLGWVFYGDGFLPIQLPVPIKHDDADDMIDTNMNMHDVYTNSHIHPSI